MFAYFNFKTSQILAISDGITANYIESSSAVLGSAINIAFNINYNNGLQLNAVVSGSDIWLVSSKVIDLPFTLTLPISANTNWGEFVWGRVPWGGV